MTTDNPHLKALHELMKGATRRDELAFFHGKGSLKYYEALNSEGLIDDVEQAAYAALQEQESGAIPVISSDVVPDGEGGLALSISVDSRAFKEKMIDEAIKSLGDREGDDPGDVVADLRAALLERDHGLPDDHLLQIAELLTEGEDVIVGVHGDSAQ